MSAGRTIRLEDLVGSVVVAGNGRRVGHIEEIRSERHHGEDQIVEYVLGSGALRERWSIVRTLFPNHSKQRIVRWDQLDISDPDHPRLTCSVDEIKDEA